MNRVAKLFNNLFSPRAVSVLGPGGYARYAGSFVSNLGRIARAGDLRPLDQAMGRTARRFRYRGRDVVFDCRFCDEQIRDGSFAFGLAREIYIRDCYFKHHAPSVFESARTVVDLGANRGAFSALMASRAERVISVEAQPEFVPVIRHNMEANGFKGFAIECSFIGEGGAFAGSSVPKITFEELLRRHEIETVDLLKMDIEGSEFALFESPGWLARVRALAMEVHPEHGDPSRVMQILKEHGFDQTIADENLKPAADPSTATFIYAWK